MADLLSDEKVCYWLGYADPNDPEYYKSTNMPYSDLKKLLAEVAHSRKIQDKVPAKVLKTYTPYGL